MKWLYGFLLVLTLLIMPGIKVAAQDELHNGYMTLKDAKGRIITTTGHQVVNGDEYLDSDNHLYRVTSVHGNTALVKLVKTNGLAASPWAVLKTYISEFVTFDFLRAEVKQKGPICIYHTHSDESYIPGDGSSSKPAHGGVFQVGDSLAKAFENQGIPVIHSKTPHDPHDAMAYDRSRRTALQLLRNRPTALIDVHRDAGPSSTYSDVVKQEQVTKVRLVVGRQNPNYQANNDFAKQIKASVDRKYPGFIKGIFYGKGKYNQDLGPRTILLEFGTEKSTKQSAERGAAIFAAAAKDVIYGPTGAGVVNRGSMRSLFWIVVALIGGVGLFLLLNRSSLKDIGKEFTGAVGEGESEPAENRENLDNRENPENRQVKNPDDHPSSNNQ